MSLAALVNESTTLQRLVQLGVHLAQWEERGHLGLATKLDFITDVAPLIRSIISTLSIFKVGTNCFN